MLEELRLNPRPPAERSQGRRAGGGGESEGGRFDPDLSTGFAEGPRLRSTAGATPIHMRMAGMKKEEVG